jgi:polyadenylate-binding protein
MMSGGAAPVGVPATGAGAAGVGRPGIPTNNAALWVGDLASDVTAQDLFDVFNATAQVASLRLCRNPATGASKGYAYVNFTSVADAQKVIEQLNYTMFKGQPCRIMWANRDATSRSASARSNIVVKKLSETTGPKELHDLASTYGDVVSCKVPIDRATGKYMGYGFVQFETPEAAAEAVVDLNGSEFEGATIEVEQFKSVEERRAAERWTNVYVKQYPRSFNEEQVRDLFKSVGSITSVHFPVDSTGAGRGFCLINFATPEAAKRAVDEVNGTEVPNPDHLADDESGGPATLALVVTRAQKKEQRVRELSQLAEKRKRELVQSTEGRNLYVKNLDERVDEEELKKFFGAYGTITSVRIQREADGRSRMFGFVCFSSREEAQKALHEANRRVLQGKPLYVAVWQPKERRQAYLAQTFQAHAMGGGALGVPMPVPMRGRMPMAPGGMGFSGVPMQHMYGGRGFPGQNMMGMTMAGMAMAGMAMAGPQPGMRRGGPGVPGASGPPRGFAHAVQAGPQPTRGAPPTAGAPPAGTVPRTAAPAPAPSTAHLTAAQLIEMEPRQRQQVIGTRLFPLVRAIDPARAPKITGMLLNGMDAGDLLGLLESQSDLVQAVRDAQGVLDSQATEAK